MSTLFLVVPGMRAVAQSCTLLSLGVDSATVEVQDRHLRYRLEQQGSQWDIDGFGWHAQALLGCTNCLPGQVRGGVMWMSTVAAEPPNAGEDELFVSLTGSMWFAATGAKGVRLMDEQKGEWSGLTMTVRRYRSDGAEPRIDQLALSASDGCLGIRLYLQSASEPRLPLEEALRPLLDSFTVRRDPAQR